MRTTLNIDDDLLIAIKEVAKRDSRPAGAVASELLRQSLARSGSEVTGGREEGPVDEFGFRPFPKRGDVVTNELIDRLREDDEFEHLCTEISKAFLRYDENEVDSLSIPSYFHKMANILLYSLCSASTAANSSSNGRNRSGGQLGICS